jgi:hypothetical protein
MVQGQSLDDYILSNYHYSDGKLLRSNTYKKWKAGSEVGTVGARGYKTLSVLGKRLYVHRIIYFLCHGSWPDLIDHINGDKCDNSIGNLREANKSINARNLNKSHKDSESGVLGVTRRKDTGRYSARFCDKSLGCFDTPEEAKFAYDAARNASPS